MRAFTAAGPSRLAYAYCSAARAGTWVPFIVSAPNEEVGLTMVTTSLDPSGHTILKLLPGGNVENGVPLMARYTAATWVAPALRSCSEACTVVSATCDRWR